MIKTRFTEEVIFPSGKKVIIEQVISLAPSTKIAKNFTLKEFANNLTTDDIKMIWNKDVAEHVAMVQDFRDVRGVPLDVSSGYRTKEFNARIGGDPKSLHLIGCASDHPFPNLTDALYIEIRSIWKTICFIHGKIGGINRYDKYVHLSSREDLFGHTEFVERDLR